MRGRRRLTIAGFAAVGLVLGALNGTAGAGRNQASLKGEGKNLKIVANIPYKGGTDMEFATIKGHDYAFTGSAPGVGSAAKGAFRVIDIDNPARPRVAATLNCSLYQADVQISHDKKTAILAADTAGGPDSCLALGKKGFMTIDISNPLKPKAIGFAEISRGSHNTTAHPTKPFVYNSDSDLAGAPGEIEIWSIKNPAKPKKVGELIVPAHSPHDISFNKKGTMAVTAAVSHIDIINTKNPAKPQLMFSTQCPGCSITHDAKFTPNGKTIVVGDEGGGGGGYPCPGGALYFYSLEGGTAPVLRGVYEPNEVLFARDGQTQPQACTSHVFDISNDGKHIAISWYSAGTRYLDISNFEGATLGEEGSGVAEIGWFMPKGGVSWSSKFFKGQYIFSNDEHRGFDVFKIVAKGHRH
jgi:hypothetical protein